MPLDSLNYIDDGEEENLLDEVPQARPAVTTHDKLWAELETLDRDAEQAKLVEKRRGFLGTAHAEKLAQLRSLQIEIAEEMTREEGNVGLDHYHELWNIGDPDELYTRLYDDRHFDLLNAHVDKTAAKLDEIAAIIDASEMNDDRRVSVDEGDDASNQFSMT